MNITSVQLFCYMENLRKMTNYKRASSIKNNSISMHNASKIVYKFKNIDTVYFLADKYTELSNLINSKCINLETLQILVFGEYIRTGFFPKIDDYNNLFKIEKIISFYNLDGFNHQLDWLILQYTNNNTTLNKFSGQKYDVFKVDSEQKNQLYYLVKDGTISLSLYIYFYYNKKFEINFSKIKDKEYAKFIKLVDLVKHINIEQIYYK